MVGLAPPPYQKRYVVTKGREGETEEKKQRIVEGGKRGRGEEWWKEGRKRGGHTQRRDQDLKSCFAMHPHRRNSEETC